MISTRAELPPTTRAITAARWDIPSPPIPMTARRVKARGSRQPHDALFGEVVDAIVGHPDWVRCNGYILFIAGTCPIRRNLAILAKSDDPSLRLRLSQLIRIAALNGTHVPIRQLLLLCSNILLGDGKNGGLIRCNDAHVIAQRNDAAARVNP